MSLWEIGYVGLSLFAIAQACVHSLQTWEHRRFARSRTRNPRVGGPTGRVAILAPCKGVDTEMLDNLRALFRQDFENYEILFIVESLDDPAAAPIRQAIDENPRVAARLICAGSSVATGQKVHNLAVAASQLPPSVQYLAFVDSDARPHAEWLTRLVQQLDHPEVIASTGYRWFVPARPSLANHLLYSIDCSIVPFVGPARHHLVWGGSWAISRYNFEREGLCEAWRGTVSDDLISAQVLRRSGKRVLFEPSCIVASPIDTSWRSMLSFIRRQYTLGRIYSPALWAWFFALASLAQIALWGNVTLAVLGLTGHGTWLWFPLITTIMLYGLQVYRGHMRQDALRMYLPGEHARLVRARRFDTWFGPFPALVSWIGLLSSARGWSIRWRGIRYDLAPGGRVCKIDRGPQADSSGKTTEESLEASQWARAA